MKTMKMTLVVVALCLFGRLGWCGGGMAGGGSGGGMGGGTEEPAPEEVSIPDLLAQFEPTWTTVTLSASLSNPGGAEAVRADASYHHALTVNTEVTLPESIHLVGTSRLLGAVAVDESSREYTIDAPSPHVSYNRPHLDLSTGERRPLSLIPSFDVNPVQGYPAALTTLRSSMQALFARRFEDVEIPFSSVPRGWTSLMSDVSVHLEEAVSGDQTYKFRLDVEYTGVNPFIFGSTISTFTGLPEALVLDIELLDGAGKVINEPGTPGAFMSSASGGGGTATITGSGSCAKCGGVERMRFVVARDLVEEEVSLNLADIPVPGF